MAVMSMYNESKHVLAPERDYDAIKNKWKALKNIKKPTGDPTCPPLVVRAKRLNKEIEDGVGVLNLDDCSDSAADFHRETSDEEPETDRSDADSGVLVESPIQHRERFTAIDPSCIVAETLVSNVVGDSFLPISDSQNVDFSSEEDQAPFGASAVVQPDHSAPLARSSRGLDLSNDTQKVPYRLGADSQKLGDMMQDIYEKRRQDKFKKGRELKKSVPENPTHTKKRTIAKELQDIDDEFERSQDRHQQNFILQQQALENRHQAEMRRLEQQNALQERRFEMESQRHQSMMLMLFSSISGTRIDPSNLGVFTHSNNSNNNNL
jgi:hypothetical protein